MKAWQWALLGLGAIVVIIVIEKSRAPSPSMSTSSNAGLGAIGGFLGGFFSKVSAPSANPGYQGPGSSTPTGVDYTGGGVGSTDLSPSSYGQQYSAAMAATAESASRNAGSGGTTYNGGLGGSGSDPLGLGMLSNPGFTTGTMGADFTS